MRGSRPLTKAEVQRLRGLFSGKWGKRNLALFVLGANTGFRISELLSLTLGDLVDERGQVTSRVYVARQNMKTKTSGRSVLLNNSARKAMVPWLRQMEAENYIQKKDFIFQTQYPGNRAITKESAWRILTKVYRAAGLSGKLGTHAMRKTFANNIYEILLARAANGEQVDPFRATSKALGHARIDSTDKYLSFREEDVDLAVDAIDI